MVGGAPGADFALAHLYYSLVNCLPRLFELGRVPLLLCPSDEQAYFGQDEGQLQLVVLQHDEHVSDFFLINSVGPRQALLARGSIGERPLELQLLLHEWVVVVAGL